MSDYVPDEVIADIFARLPLKNLIQFRSLSKPWLSRIDSSEFIRKHTSLSPKKVLLRHGNHLGITRMEEFDTSRSRDRLRFCQNHEQWNIIPQTFCGYSLEDIGSCNGVLCLFNDTIITLWNPSIRRELTLHYHSVRGDGSKDHVFGFGCDPFTGHYKIVTILYQKETTGVAESSFVFCMKTGAWRPIAPPTTMFFDVVTSSGYFVNGVLHWIVMKDQKHRYILTFDLSAEVFGMITLPEPSCECKKVTTISDSLAVISDDDSYDFLWVRKENNNVSSWSMVYKSGRWVANFLSLANGNLLMNSFFYGFLVYNPTTRMESKPVKFEDSRYVEMEMYVESLVLMDIFGTASTEF